MRRSKEFIEFRCQAAYEIYSIPDWNRRISKVVKRRKKSEKLEGIIIPTDTLVKRERKEGDRTCDYCDTKLALLNPSKTCWTCQGKLRQREIDNEIACIKET
jgi:CRISPR/Cas system-associated protein Cas10 (large subunit of type III CRISPR-Cas system)